MFYVSDRVMVMGTDNSKWWTRRGRYLRLVHRLSALYRIKMHRRLGDMNVFCNNYTSAITVLKSLQFACDSTGSLGVRSMDMQIIQTIGLSGARFVKKWNICNSALKKNTWQKHLFVIFSVASLSIRNITSM